LHRTNPILQVPGGNVKKLKLNPDTVRVLTAPELAKVAGGGRTGSHDTCAVVREGK
jgi:hypothetical protein